MSNVLQKQVYSGVPFGPAAGSEYQAAYSGRVQVTLPTVRAIVKGWLSAVPATGTTYWQLRIVRGNWLTGNQVGPTVYSYPTVAKNDEMCLQVSEQLLNMEFVDYSLAFTASGASANTSFSACLLEVELING